MKTGFLRAYKIGIKDLPFALLLIDFVWMLLGSFGVYISDYWVFGELHGHSLALTFVLAFYGIVHRFCLYAWTGIAGLATLNILNIVHYFVDFRYLQTYAGFILITSLCFALIFLIRKKKCTL